MNISNKTLQRVCFLFSIIFAGLFLNSLIARGIDETIFLLATLSLCSFFLNNAYRLSIKYKAANSLDVLVKRQDENLVIKNAQKNFAVNSKETTIAVAKVSLITVGDEYLSVIIDGNGKGYDFYLTGKRDEICRYICSLFSDKEINNIELKFA